MLLLFGVYRSSYLGRSNRRSLNLLNGQLYYLLTAARLHRHRARPSKSGNVKALAHLSL